MKKILTVLLALLCGTVLFAGGAKEGSSAATTGYKDTIVFGQGADVTSFDPHVGKETPAVAVTNHIYDTLVDTDPVTGEVVPQIAERWEQLSPVSYRFFIRKGLTFHNGEELKADDVKFSLDRAIASASVSYIVDFIKEVVVEDDYTVVVTTKAPYGPTLRNLAVPFAAIVPKDYVSANPDALKMKPVGSGPYKFVSWAQSDNVKLEAFDSYFKGAPKTKYLVMKVIPEAAQRTIALETGEIDLSYDILVSDMKRVEANKNLTLFEAPSLTCFYISFNMKKAPFDNQLVRQAINMAIDRQLLVDTVNNGTGAAADEIIAPAVYGYYSTGVWEYNPTKAKELLAQAGYPNGFSCTLWVNNNQSRVEMCQAIQEMLREIGITCKVEVMEFGTFISRSTAGEHDMGYFGWVTSTKDGDYTYYSLEHSSQQGAPGNRSFINDSEVDRLVELGRTSADTKVRDAAYKDLALRLKEVANNAPIIYTAITAGASNKVQDFVLDPIGYHRLEGISVTK
ncbi:ABC-type dipeptide transport system, periplasmic component [Sphaerochaeta pleomorpha str. Grapes]|uniref:ABC-type dipeptide transport system, periplasmic component n=1 Tax=Sphaerochaeta pleomorpha (strain ATCC BAA-1885 / DSM 22778 / Grapes) TaxID=158190 RepID=G8QZ01_SPHPG|nr:ABC transporter substrate-binding protein [Sphaerochaeta pleomorpha]AEV30860.1 ABC-type dipeptide transport system, periplasmic component [Sphaerochaeta pleomorpha str. Grapes]